jgi:hypothetical protein
MGFDVCRPIFEESLLRSFAKFELQVGSGLAEYLVTNRHPFFVVGSSVQNRAQPDVKLIDLRTRCGLLGTPGKGKGIQKDR